MGVRIGPKLRCGVQSLDLDLEIELEAPRERRRAAVVEALSELGVNRVVPLLLEALDAANTNSLRLSIAHLLGQFRDARAIPQLIELLADRWRSIRIEAARALGELGDDRVVPHLIEVVEQGVPILDQAAAEALTKLGHGSVGVEE